MNNTEKLLRAFIEASGYEVEEVYNLEPDEFVVKQGFRAVPDDYKVAKKEKEIIVNKNDIEHFYSFEFVRGDTVGLKSSGWVVQSVDGDRITLSRGENEKTT